MTLEEILAGESKNLEFKVRRPKDSIKYMKSVVAFANGEGGNIRQLRTGDYSGCLSSDA